MLIVNNRAVFPASLALSEIRSQKFSHASLMYLQLDTYQEPSFRSRSPKPSFLHVCSVERSQRDVLQITLLQVKSKFGRISKHSVHVNASSCFETIKRLIWNTMFQDAVECCAYAVFVGLSASMTASWSWKKPLNANSRALFYPFCFCFSSSHLSHRTVSNTFLFQSLTSCQFHTDVLFRPKVLLPQLWLDTCVLLTFHSCRRISISHSLAM